MENTPAQNVGVVLLTGGAVAVAILLVAVVVTLLHGRPLRRSLLSLFGACVLAASGVALILLDADRVRPFDTARAGALAHVTLTDPADLGSGWSVTGVDPPDSSSTRHPGEACTRMRAMERDTDANYDPHAAGRAAVHLWRAPVSGSPIATTVEVEVVIFPNVDNADGAVAAWREIALAATTSQCLADDTGAGVSTRDPLLDPRANGFAASYAIRQASALLPDLRHERHQWRYRNAMVTVSLTGSSAGVDAALVRAAVGGMEESTRRTAEDQDAALQQPRRYVPHLDRVVTALQEESTALDVARQLGDEAVAARGADLAEVARRTEESSARLRQIERLPETAAFHDAVSAWAFALTQATRGGSDAWAARPAAPAPAALTVSAPQRQALAEALMPRVTAAGASTPAALARRDTASLRWIRARIAVQLRLLERLGEGAEDVCVRSGCLRPALPAIQQLRVATDLIAAGTANAPGVEWSKAWSAVDLAIRPGGQPIIEAGLAQGTPDAAPISAPVRLFADTCREGGGRVDDTGGVRALPTTEGGWTCWSADKACWHFLTHSGALYTFGDTGVGCPPLAALPIRLGGGALAQAGVVRVADPPPAARDPAPRGAPAAPAATGAWDGVYRVTTGRQSCTVRESTTGMADSFTQEIAVRQNVIQWEMTWDGRPDPPVPIDASGRASSTVPGISAHFSHGTDWAFTRDAAGVARFEAREWSRVVDDENIASVCTLPFSGVRSGP